MAAVLLPSKIKRQKIMDTAIQSNKTSRKRISDLLFILWAGGAALLSYSLVYMLRKPYTAAAFEDLEVFNMDYKVAVTIVQILGYVVSKFMGIKLISELRREERLRFILMSVVMAELSLVFFGLLSAPYNIAAMFLNGLSLGCMWGIIFSFIEGRRMTDVLASLLGVSMVISSGTAKSVGLYVMDIWQDRGGGIAFASLVGICAKPASTTYGGGYRLEVGAGDLERAAALGAFQELHAFLDDAFRGEYSDRGVTGYQGGLLGEYH